MKWKSIDNDPNMGLQNKECLFKDYYCGLHRVYMDTEDVRRKKCLCKPTFDMMGTNRCPYLKEHDA